jgi:hypothetical protein
MSESQHWYNIDGIAVHTQNTKKGAKNPTRPTNIRDARDQKLFPSVSGITGMVANPALVGYMMREAVKASYSRPAIHEETEAEYISFILNKSREDGLFAARLGTQIHEGLERHYSEPLLGDETCLLKMQDGSTVNMRDFIEPAIIKVDELGLCVSDPECVVVNAPYGYAGKTDLPFTMRRSASGIQVGIADFKSKRTKVGQKVEPYKSQIMQISAYIAAHWGSADGDSIPKNAVGYNIFISTTEVGRIDVVEYDYDTLVEAWSAFKACLLLWRYNNDFDPRIL